MKDYLGTFNVDIKETAETIRPEEFISIPGDRLQEIHVNQIPLDQLSDEDKTLLFNDVYDALADSEKDLRSYRNYCNCIDCGGTFKMS